MKGPNTTLSITKRGIIRSRLLNSLNAFRSVYIYRLYATSMLINCANYATYIIVIHFSNRFNCCIGQINAPLDFCCVSGSSNAALIDQLLFEQTHESNKRL